MPRPRSAASRPSPSDGRGQARLHGGILGRLHRAEREARDLASELGVIDRSVFFNDGWVPYERRADWLLDASCAISTHRSHVETRLAFRTRLLDCFWAELPVVCTGGDELGERIERDGLGVTVPEGDAEAVAAALEAVLERGRDAYSERLRLEAEQFAWSTVAEPLFASRHRPRSRLRWEATGSPGRPCGRRSIQARGGS